MINVDELPNPQFLGKVSFVFTKNPFLSFKKSGFKRFASCRISNKVSAINSALPSLSELKLADFKRSFGRSKTASNQQFPVLVKLAQTNSGSCIDSTNKSCPNFVGIAKAFAPSKTRYSPVNSNFPFE